jgi:hypothetical protein
MKLSRSVSFDLDDFLVWKDLAIEGLFDEPGSDAFRLLYQDTRCCVSEAILRINGRRTATDAAMIPVPGSAVAKIVALTALAGTC